MVIYIYIININKYIKSLNLFCFSPLSAVVAGPDDKWGERPVVFVAVKKRSTLQAQEIVAHCRDSLAGYKVKVRKKKGMAF